jgi:hypothetical protein
MNILIEAMTIDHYDEVMALWKKSENIGLSSADQREKIQAYLDRNPGMSFVAKDNGPLSARLCAAMTEDEATSTIWPLQSLTRIRAQEESLSRDVWNPSEMPGSRNAISLYFRRIRKGKPSGRKSAGLREPISKWFLGN